MESKGFDWVKLREEYFNDCVDKYPPNTIPRIILAPHDMFEWFKIKLTNENHSH